MKKAKEIKLAKKRTMVAFETDTEDLLEIRVVQKVTKLSFSSLVRYLLQVGFDTLKNDRPDEIVRRVFQFEAEREIAKRFHK